MNGATMSTMQVTAVGAVFLGLASAGLAVNTVASAGTISCGEIAYPNSREVGILTVDPGGPTCADATAVLIAHFADVLGETEQLRPLPESSSLQRYDCFTDFQMAGGMKGTTECRYIIGEGNAADDAMEIVVLPN
jgi:hypothetical protein